MHMATADTTTATPRNSTPRFSQTLFLGRLVQSPNRSQAGFEVPSRSAERHANAPSILQTNEAVRIGSANSGAGGEHYTISSNHSRFLSIVEPSQILLGLTPQFCSTLWSLVAHFALGSRLDRSEERR